MDWRERPYGFQKLAALAVALLAPALVFSLVFSLASSLAFGEREDQRSPFDPPPRAKPTKTAKAQPKPGKLARHDATVPRAVDASPAFPGEDDESAFEPPRAVSAESREARGARERGSAARPERRKIARRGRSGPGPLPAAGLSARIDRLWAEINARPARGPIPAESIPIQSSANKQDWLKEAYARNLVDASRVPYMLADKLAFYEVLKRELGSDAAVIYPKTLGLKQFLERRRLVDAEGRLKADPDAVEQALADEFPYGFIVRPAVGVAPRETERGLFPRSDQLVAELFAPQSAVYDPASYRAAIRSHILGGIASGEAVVLQEDTLLRADARRRLNERKMGLARVHSYEGRVVVGASPEPWVRGQSLTADQERRAEAFVASVLARLSERLLARQAWSFDVAVFDNGDMRVFDVVTNRGRRIAWSSYLDQPRVLGAYSRLWEEQCGVVFQGVSGAILRHNLGNYFPYWGKRIEAAKAPWKKALAFLPPAP